VASDADRSGSDPSTRLSASAPRREECARTAHHFEAEGSPLLRRRDLGGARRDISAVLEEQRRHGQERQHEYRGRGKREHATHARRIRSQRVERLAGNIGYLDLREFLPPGVAGDTATAAMTFLSSAEAVVFELRQNGGGDPAMVAFLSDVFVAHQRNWWSICRRGLAKRCACASPAPTIKVRCARV
jgi:hypothetical protein